MNLFFRVRSFQMVMTLHYHHASMRFRWVDCTPRVRFEPPESYPYRRFSPCQSKTHTLVRKKKKKKARGPDGLQAKETKPPKFFCSLDLLLLLRRIRAGANLVAFEPPGGYPNGEQNVCRAKKPNYVVCPHTNDINREVNPRGVRVCLMSDSLNTTETS